MAKTPAKSSPAKAKRRRSAFVPRVLGPVAIVGAIPACVVAACGGNVVVDPGTTSVASSVGSGVASSSTGFFVAYLAYEAGAGGSVGNGGSTGVTGSAASSSSSTGFVVAAVAYPAYDGGTG